MCASSVAARVSGSSVRSRHRPVSSSTARNPIHRRGPQRGADDAAVGAERGRDDRERRARRIREQRPAGRLHALPEDGRGAEPAAEHDQRPGRARSRARRARAPARRPPRRRGRRAPDRRARPRPARPRPPARAPAARDALDRRRAERDRLPARARVRAAVDDEADARARPDDREQERRAARRRPERRLGERRGPHVRLEHDAGRLDRGGEVETAPVDRVGARGPSVEADELAEPDPDRQRALAERSPPEPAQSASTAAPPRSGRVGTCARSSTRPRRDVDETGGDLRPADVYADGEGHARRPGTCVSHRSIVSYPRSREAAPLSEEGT